MASNHLAAVTEGSLVKGLVARLHPDCSVEDVRVGSFVKIQGEQFDFFCLITDVVLEAANRGVVEEPPGPEDVFLRDVLSGTATYGSVAIQPMLMLNKQPLELADLNEIGGPLPVRTVPVHFAPVDAAEKEDFERVFAPPGETSWEIGSPLDMDIPILIDLKRVSERSNGVFGKSGSGKSMLTRVLLCGLMRTKQAANLIFDMHAEYAWTKRDPVSGVQLRSLQELFGQSRVRVYTLGSKVRHTDRPRGDGEIWIGLNEIDVEDISLLSDLLNLNETAIETIYLLQGHLGEEWINRLLKMDSPEISDMCEQIGGHAGAVSALRRKLNRLTHLDFITEERLDPSRSSIKHIVDNLSQGLNVVLAFEQEDDPLLAYMLVANIITRRIHREWTRATQAADKSGGPRPHPLVITVEEAHRFLSPSAARHTSFGTIARELRKFNVTLFVVDQRPSAIDPEVLSQIGSRFTCQLNDESDIAAVLAGVSGASHLRSVLATLESSQQAMLLGHALPMPVVVKVRTIDDHFYEDVMAGAKGAAFPMGRRARESATLPDD